MCKGTETEGISQEQIRAIAHTDLDHQGNFRAAWHCVDDRSIYIFAQTKRSQGLRKVVPLSAGRRRSSSLRELTNGIYSPGGTD